MDRRILNELQAITGIKTNDMDYLVCKVLQGGTYFREDTAAKEISKSIGVEVMDLDRWFEEKGCEKR